MKSSLRRKVGRGSLAAVFAAALALAPALPVAADEAVDQHQDTMGISPGQGVAFVAQSFTPSRTGSLTMVSIGSRKSTTLALRVSVRDADQTTQKPTGTDLAAAPADARTWGQTFQSFRPVTSTGAPLTVIGGHKYAIVMQAPAALNVFFWYYSTDSSSYPGRLTVCGSACSNAANWNAYQDAQELAFQTWMLGGPSPSPTPRPNVAPTVQSNSSSVTVPEGSAAPSMTGTYGDADGDTVAFTATPGTVVRTTGTSQGTWTWTGAAASDESTQNVTVFGNDNHGHVTAASFTVTVTNVAPTATMLSITNTVPIVLATGENVTFTGSFTDPGVMDTHTATWTWDGTSSPPQDLGQGGSGTSTWVHHFATTGAHSVAFTVLDDDGGQGTATVTVNVMTTGEAIDAISRYLANVQGLNKGQLNSLQVKLDSAKASFGRGDDQACSNQLGAFLNELLADAKTGKVSTTDADNLGLAVTTIKGSLGTYNRFLEWLPLTI